MSISESLRDESKRIPSEAIERLRGRLKGGCYIAGQPEYETARTIWNAMIDRRPAVVVRPSDASDVAQAVDFAREQDVVLAVRGGGHNIAGNAVSDGGVMIDLTSMKSILVDTANRTVKVGPGVTLGELDAATQAHGLATPLGINSTTGVAGLTLGGGFGWISRKHGLTADNLVAADVVTAEGRVLRASDRENPDLFWALRGGGGNFGVVTSFEYRLHPVGPEVLAGLIVHPFSNAKELFEGYRRVSAAAPDELAIWVVLRKAPPLPFLPADVHGKEIFVIAVCYVGASKRPQGHRAGAGARHADRRRDRPGALRGLADRSRSAPHPGREELLEVAQLHPHRRRSDRCPRRRRFAAPRRRMRGRLRPAGRRDQPPAGRCHGVPAP
jgi:FAD/FMN-containing dehydrogenase